MRANVSVEQKTVFWRSQPFFPFPQSFLVLLIPKHFTYPSDLLRYKYKGRLMGALSLSPARFRQLREDLCEVSIQDE